MYTDFSGVYDLFMDNVPYENWASGISEYLAGHGIEDGLVLDLGCGTGALTRLLSDAGYDMIGIDSSEDMLFRAMQAEWDDEPDDDIDAECDVSDMYESDETGSAGSGILYLNQDITDFELYGTVRAVVSTCDTLNYVTDENRLINTFRLVNNYLEPDGIFLFDMNAPEKYEEVLADNVFAENRDDASFIWENSYDSESRINEFALTLFIEEEESGLYEKSEEFHYQRAYSRDEIKAMLDSAGLEIIDNKEEDMRMYYAVKVIEGRKIGNTGASASGQYAECK